jgi:hypothetical protein
MLACHTVGITVTINVHTGFKAYRRFEIILKPVVEASASPAICLGARAGTSNSFLIYSVVFDSSSFSAIFFFHVSQCSSSLSFFSLLLPDSFHSQLETKSFFSTILPCLLNRFFLHSSLLGKFNCHNCSVNIRSIKSVPAWMINFWFSCK